MVISDHRELRNSHVKFMLWVVYERIAVTVRLRLRCFLFWIFFWCRLSRSCQYSNHSNDKVKVVAESDRVNISHCHCHCDKFSLISLDVMPATTVCLQPLSVYLSFYTSGVLVQGEFVIRAKLVQWPQIKKCKKTKIPGVFRSVCRLRTCSYDFLQLPVNLAFKEFLFSWNIWFEDI